FFRRFTALAMLIVFFLSALWHGVGLGYLIWGLGHAALMIGRFQLARAGVISTKMPVGTRRYIAIALTFICGTLLWLPFAINAVHHLGVYLSNLVSFTATSPRINVGNALLLELAVVVAFAFPNSHELSLGGRRSPWLLPLAVILFALAVPLAVGRLTPPP